MSSCKTCGKEILWITMTSGKAMPVDFASVYITNIGSGKKTFITEDGKTVKADAVTKSATFGYTPHWANCNNPNVHRKGKQ